MATVLLGWEIGEGLNYARSLVRIARALADRGHRPVFALRHLAETWPVIGDAFPAVQAPLWHPRRWRDFQPFVAATFADVLALKGFAGADDLLPLVRGWDGLLDLTGARLVVAAYAPALCLAAAPAVPVVNVSEGWFGLPPHRGPDFPALVPGRPPVLPADHLLAVAREVQRRRGRPAPPTLPGALAGDARFLMMLPDLDPYRPHRDDPYWDPLDGLPAPRPAPPDRSFFAYLNADYPRVDEILWSLAQAGWRGQAYLRGATPEFRAQLRQHRVDVLDRPVGADALLDRAVVLHHGGVGTSQVALAGGRPQLLFPTHLEQEINGRTLHQLGVAHYLVGPFPMADVLGAADEVRRHPRLVERVAALAAEIARRERAPPLPAVLAWCERALR